MNKQKTVLLGFFVVAVILLTIVVLLTLGGRSMFTKQIRYTLFFDKSVKGLNAGAPVMFRGVRIGQVQDIRLTTRIREQGDGVSISDWPIEVTINLEPTSLDVGRGKPLSSSGLIDKITEDSILLLRGQELVDEWIERMVTQYNLCARLQSMSLLTGQLYIEMDCLPDFPPSKEEIKALGDKIIPTRISAFERLFLSLQRRESTTAIQHAISMFGDFVTSGKAQKVLENLYEVSNDAKEITTSLSASSGKMKFSLPLIMAQGYNVFLNANKLLNTINESAPQLLESSQKTLSELNVKIVTIGEKLDKLADTFNAVGEKLEQDADLVNGPAAGLLVNLDETVKQMRDVCAGLNDTLKAVQEKMEPDSPEQLGIRRSLGEIERATGAIRHLAETLQRNPEAIIRGKK